MKMPQLVGKTVAQAQWILPASMRIVYVDHKSNDPVIWARNGQVCKQEPAAGTKGVSEVVLTVVRRGEACKVSH